MPTYNDDGDDEDEDDDEHTDLVHHDEATLAPHTPRQRLFAKAQNYVKAGRASNTQRAYRHGVQLYVDWCAEVEFPPEPITPTKVALFATTLAETGRAWSTINVALSAIDYSLKLRGLDPVRTSREVAEVCAGIRRVHGTAQRGAQPITVEQLRTICESLTGPAAVRDRALLLLGFSGAFRRSELTGLVVGDLTREENGYVVRLRRSKTDQTGQGMMKGIPFGGRAITCPVRALDGWLAARESGGQPPEPSAPLFLRFSPCCPRSTGLTDQSVNSVVKARMKAAGFDVANYSGHSLRAGFVTAAAKAGKRLDLIMTQTGHRNVETVMRYIRHVELFRENPAEGLGL